MVVEHPVARGVVEVPAPQRPVRVSWRDDGASAVFRNRAASVPGVRALVRGLMVGDAAEAAGVAEVVASELAGNATRHTRGMAFEVVVRHDPARRVSSIAVEDEGPRETVPTFPAGGVVATDEEALWATGGRGLGMVARLCPAGYAARPVPGSDRWVVEAHVSWEPTEEGGDDDHA